MSSGLKKGTNIVFAVIIGSIVVIGLVWFLNSRSEPAEVATVEAPLVAETQYAEDILAAVQLIKEVLLDTAFFQNPLFLELEDFSVAVPVVTPRGRQNPFLPF